MHAYFYGFLLAVALGATSLSAQAQAIDEAQLRNFVLDQVHAGAGRAEVEIEQLDTHLRRASCARLEPFLPGGARLWGRSTVGVRCADGTRWSTYIPIHVRIYGPALVAARGLNAGEAPDASDVRIEEVELTREAPGLLTDPAQLEHTLLRRALAPGE